MIQTIRKLITYAGASVEKSKKILLLVTNRTAAATAAPIENSMTEIYKLLRETPAAKVFDRTRSFKAWLVYIGRFQVTSLFSKIRNSKATTVFILIRKKRRRIYTSLQFCSSIVCFVWKSTHF